MLSIRRPTVSAIENFIQTQGDLDYSYVGVGASAAEPPPGYVVDRSRADIGKGEGTFTRAKDAISRWHHFRLGWVELCWPTTAIQEREVVAVLARIAGIWWLNACRVVYVVDEPRKFGFAYGTLPDHAESGEERFMIEWDDDDSVWYDILAFSRPNGWLAYLGYPYARYLQGQFRKDSVTAVRRSLGNAR